jgi:arylsulfatase A-like enzyme
VVDDAIAWLEEERAARSGAPVFTWLLFLDAHEPVDAAVRRGRTPQECQGVDPLPLRWQGIAEWAARGDAREPPVLSCRRALYREALRSLDAELGRLMRHLEESGRAERTGVVLLSDHGEEFWEHAAAEIAAGLPGQRGYGHGHTLHAELLEVPLLVVPPGGLAAPVRSRQLAAVSDVFATLLGMAGAEPPAPSRSLDLLRLLNEPAPAAWRAALPSENTLYGPQRSALTTPALRAIRTQGRGVLVFDRRADPGEQRPLPAGAPLAREGAELLEAAERLAAPASPPGAADRAALRALGYLD